MPSRSNGSSCCFAWISFIYALTWLYVSIPNLRHGWKTECILPHNVYMHIASKFNIIAEKPRPTVRKDRWPLTMMCKLETFFLLRWNVTLSGPLTLLKLRGKFVIWDLDMNIIVMIGYDPVISMSLIVKLCICEFVCLRKFRLVWLENRDKIHPPFPLPIHHHVCLIMVD